MLKVFAMCGVAFSGKSTLAAKIVDALPIELISLDAINHELGLHGGKGMSIVQWEDTSAIAMERVRRELRQERSVVVDDTFSHRFLRDRCRSVADEFAAHFSIVFVDTPIEKIRARRIMNDAAPTRHRIRDDVFEAHYNGFQYPTDDEPVVRVDSTFDVTAWLKQQSKWLGKFPGTTD